MQIYKIKIRAQIEDASVNVRLWAERKSSGTRKLEWQPKYFHKEAPAYSSMSVNEFLDYSAGFYNAPGAEKRKLERKDISV